MLMTKAVIATSNEIRHGVGVLISLLLKRKVKIGVAWPRKPYLGFYLKLASEQCYSNPICVGFPTDLKIPVQLLTSIRFVCNIGIYLQKVH